MNEYGGVGPWIFLYIQYIFSRLGQYVKLCIMQQRETEKYLMGLVSRRTLLYSQYVYRGRLIGRNWYKILSPLLTYLLFPPPLSKTSLKLVCNVNVVNLNLKSKKIVTRNLREIVCS